MAEEVVLGGEQREQVRVDRGETGVDARRERGQIRTAREHCEGGRERERATDRKKQTTNK